ncbi:MAG: hypothetical protein R3C68_10010 [Myxococcota bacterium]
MGDNFTDEQAAGISGQDIFWLRSIDSFGNAGDAVPSSQIAPPGVTVDGIERLVSAPDTWDTGTTFKAAETQPNGRVLITVTGQLGSLPHVIIADGTTVVFDVPCSSLDITAYGSELCVHV